MVAKKANYSNPLDSINHCEFSVGNPELTLKSSYFATNSRFLIIPAETNNDLLYTLTYPIAIVYELPINIIHYTPKK